MLKCLAPSCGFLHKSSTERLQCQCVGELSSRSVPEQGYPEQQFHYQRLFLVFNIVCANAYLQCTGMLSLYYCPLAKWKNTSKFSKYNTMYGRVLGPT